MINDRNAVGNGVGESSTESQRSCASITLGVDDRHHPFQLPAGRKLFILATGLFACFNSTLGSSLPSGATISLSRDFSLSPDSTSMVLLNSLYMAGFACAPLLCAPLSEIIGRRPVFITTYTLHTLCTICCAVAPSYTALLAFRLLAGICASVPNGLVGGLIADVFDGPDSRGKAMGIYMMIGLQGTLVGPLISGFISTSLGWRWTFWLGSIIAGVGIPFVWLLPETYSPVIAQKMAEKVQGVMSSTKGREYFFRNVKIMLTRPALMMAKEPSLLFPALYLAIVYGMLYLFFQAYPMVYRATYGLSQNTIGLAYIPVMVGTALGLAIYHAFGVVIARKERADPSWTITAETRRISLACIGAPLITASLFILSFATTPKIHPIIPIILSGSCFGVGCLLIFCAVIVYLSDIFKRYAASAQAAASTTRCILAIGLPFAAPTMYESLGVQWSGVTLAVISSVATIIPVVFLVFQARFQVRGAFAG